MPTALIDETWAVPEWALMAHLGIGSRVVFDRPMTRMVRDLNKRALPWPGEKVDVAGRVGVLTIRQESWVPDGACLGGFHGVWRLEDEMELEVCWAGHAACPMRAWMRGWKYGG